jgi:hypothetical protein
MDRLGATVLLDLSPIDRAVLLAFASFADRRIVPTEANLVALSRVSPSTVHRSIKRLRIAGYLIPTGVYTPGRADRSVPTYRVVVKP